MVQSTFGAWDYAIMAITMTASMAIGLYFRFSGGKQKTNEEYLLADRNLSVFPVAVSLMASFVSAITLLGLSAENYYYGFQFIVINFSYAIATPITSSLYLPVFFGLQKTSAYEYLELRFGSRLRLLASLTYTLQMILYNGIVLYVPATVLESVIGLDKQFSILVVGLACTIYSTLGGMKAVVFTDLLQAILMLGAMVSVVIFASVQLGGFGQIFIKAHEGGRLDVMNFSVDPTERHTWFSLVIGGSITFLSLFAVNHTQIQRLLTVSTLKQSRQCLWWSWPVISVIVTTTCISGISIYAVYKDCDPLASNAISSIDQIMPYYVINAMSNVPGLAGLFVAGIFSACLSTISAACNALAAVTLTDYVSRWFTVRSSYIPWLTKLATCGYGLLFLALAFVAEHLGGVMQAAMTIFGAVGGPLLGIFTLGMFTTFANERGVSIALLSGIAISMWISFGQPRPLPVKLPVSVDGCLINVTLPAPVQIQASDYFYLYRISYMWISLIGFVWVLLVGSVVSLAWKQRQPWQKEGREHPNPALFTPPLARKLRARNEKSLDK